MCNILTNRVKALKSTLAQVWCKWELVRKDTGTFRARDRLATCTPKSSNLGMYFSVHGGSLGIG